MDTIKRYWHALGDAPRKAIIKCFRVELIFTVVCYVMLAAVWLWMRSLEGAEPGLWVLDAFGYIGVLFIFLLVYVVYSYVLIFRAHRAIKTWLFELNAPGYPTADTWSRKDGWLLGCALIGGIGLPFNIASLPGLSIMDSFTTLPGTMLWIVLGIVLPPFAARRFIPLGK
ncbi:hypothetical protein [Collinsella tanakaei]|uniref:hypothetical protein n=1 Tax=Collinsella tanakaei TaxID=626935 RepID=UPI0025A3C278|nr:hypothetical protein [Collinsella tanakaei]MDM8301207.1 hypothetical protein [Collinsella tanakaei]